MKKCKHEECQYRDCNYHYCSTGIYINTEESEIPFYIPICEEDAKKCISYMDI